MQQTLASIFYKRVEEQGDNVAVRFKTGRGPYRDMRWKDFGQMVKEMACGLASLGFKPGSAGAIMSQTSHLWVASDLAIMSNGALSIPIYPTSSQADIEFILNNSEAQFAFVQNESLMKKVLNIREKLPNLKKIVLLSAGTDGKSLSDLKLPEGIVLGLEELQEAGRRYTRENPDLIDRRLSESQPDGIATVIYTSGTTGLPKGVALTHSNIIGVMQDLPAIIPLSHDDVYLAFLPLSHVFERVCGEFYWLYNGCICAFAEGIEHVAKNIGETQPTIILVVPRVLDRIHAKVRQGIQGASGRARQLIEWSIEVGREMFQHASEGRKARIGLKAKYWLAEKLVFKKLRARIGPSLKRIVSGGAPATREVIEFFNAIGIATLEGYGLTETSAPVSVNRIDKIKAGTVGPALPSVEIKIAEDGEILLKGPGVFSGYFKSEQMTAEVFDGEGWFHSGDIGIIDGDNYLKITDRKKDLIINSAGKNIAPQRIEAVLKTAPLVTQAIVFGDKRKHLVAILTLDEQATIEFAREKGWNFRDFKDLSCLPALHHFLHKKIVECSKELADYERVRNFSVLARDLSVEEGELTPTLKVKRNVVSEKFKEMIETLYKDGSGITARV